MISFTRSKSVRLKSIPDRLTPAQKFSRCICDDDTGRLLYRACKAASGSEVRRRSRSKTSGASPYRRKAHARMHSMAVDHAKAKGHVLIQRRLLRIFTRSPITLLCANRVKREHLEHAARRHSWYRRRHAERFRSKRRSGWNREETPPPRARAIIRAPSRSRRKSSSKSSLAITRQACGNSDTRSHLQKVLTAPENPCSQSVRSRSGWRRWALLEWFVSSAGQRRLPGGSMSYRPRHDTAKATPRVPRSAGKGPGIGVNAAASGRANAPKVFATPLHPPMAGQ